MLRDHSTADGAACSTVGNLSRREFAFLPPVVKLEREMDFTDGDDIIVLTNLSLTCGCVVSSHEGIAFERFVLEQCKDGAPVAQRAPAKRRAKPLSMSVREALLDAHDWLSDDDLAKPQVPRRRAVGAADEVIEPILDGDVPVEPGSDDGGASDSDMPVLEDEDEEPMLAAAALGEAEAVAEHAAIAAALAWDEAPLYFAARTLGGKWCGKHLGVGSNSYGGFARTEVVKTWCENYAFPKQAVFTYAAYDGQENCAELAREYCRRGEYFFVTYIAAGDPLYTFCQADVDAYTEALPWLDFICELELGSVLSDRALSVSALAPRLDR